VLEAAADAYVSALQAAGWDASLIGHAVRDVERSVQGLTAAHEDPCGASPQPQDVEVEDGEIEPVSTVAVDAVCTEGNGNGSSALQHWLLVK
jgi:hypothetical protein